MKNYSLPVLLAIAASAALAFYPFVMIFVL